MKNVHPWDMLDDVGELIHSSTYEEIDFLQAVANGDVDIVEEKCSREKCSELEGLGALSRNPLLNLKYHFIITTALVARMCITRGMGTEYSFTKSDFYIKLLDDVHSLKEIDDLYEKWHLITLPV